MPAPSPSDLALPTLRQSYLEGKTTPRAMMDRVLAACDAGDPRIWITRLDRGAVMAHVERLERLERSAPADLPLYGVPFAIKDNIDLAGVPTTAGCPDYAYLPGKSAFAVQRLIDAGAIPIGKTNLDQFATGLVGIRSPHGHPSNLFNADYIPGGSSSGSAVAVSSGLVSFALGTDTAGSGRVPASLNHLAGLKPSRGLVSCSGVVPACRSLDCVTVFARTVAETARVLEVMAAFDADDPYSRIPDTPVTAGPDPARARIGVPERSQLKFFGNTDAEQLFAAAVARSGELGSEVVEIDFSPFIEAALLLYEGPWVAERYAAIEEFLESRGDAVFPVTRRIIEGGRALGAVETFRAEYRLRELKRRADTVWSSVDAIMTPTLGAPYTVAEVEADPVRLNSNLGYYTNFMNLLDYAAIALPAGFLTQQGMPWGITLFGPAFRDAFLIDLGRRFEGGDGAAGLPGSCLASGSPRVEVAVCGAHLSGLPLNHQLTTRGAHLVRATRTAACYRMFALPPTGSLPPRPGLVRDEEGGAEIAVEIWSIPASAFGTFVDGIASPLGMGKLLLDDGGEVSGFLCESWATREAEEITRHGGWRAWLAAG